MGTRMQNGMMMGMSFMLPKGASTEVAMQVNLKLK